MKINNKKPERTQIMKPKELAEYLGIHVITLYRLMKQNKIPGCKIGGQWRFKRDIIDEWIEKNTILKEV